MLRCMNTISHHGQNFTAESHNKLFKVSNSLYKVIIDHNNGLLQELLFTLNCVTGSPQ